jgi:hypothetical protein
LQLVLIPQTNSYTLVYALPVIYLLFVNGGVGIRVYLFLAVGLLPWAYQMISESFILGTEQLIFPIVILIAFAAMLSREIPVNDEDEKAKGLTPASP